MKRLTALAFFCLLSSPAWATFNGYTYRRTLTIDHTKVQNTDQNLFPVLISTVSATLATTGNGGHVSNSSGFDIVFSTDSNNVGGHCYAEQERYSATTGEAIYWVRVDTVATASDTTLYMFYGNASVSVQQSTPTFVWADGKFQGVFHYGNGTSLSNADSTSNGVTGTTTGASAAVGQADGAASFASGNNINYGNVSNYNFGTNDFTLSVWVKFASGASGYVANKRLLCNDAGFWSISVGPNVELEVSSTGNSAAADSVGSIDDSTYHYISGTRSGANVKLYVDGSANGTATNPGGAATVTTTGNMKVGIGAACSGNLVGQVDEFRMASGIARSADWIKTEFNNQSNWNTFFTFGSETTGTVATPVCPQPFCGILY